MGELEAWAPVLVNGSRAMAGAVDLEDQQKIPGGKQPGVAPDQWIKEVT